MSAIDQLPDSLKRQLVVEFAEAGILPGGWTDAIFFGTEERRIEELSSLIRDLGFGRDGCDEYKTTLQAIAEVMSLYVEDLQKIQEKME